MLPLIEQHRQEIVDLCRKYHVTHLDLFGSVARRDFKSAGSDLDFFVEFEDLGWKGSFKRYMGLKLDLEEMFGCPVDLVEPKMIVNPYFFQVANQHRLQVYAA